MDRKTKKLLTRVGYFRLKGKYGDDINPNTFPSLKISDHRDMYPSIDSGGKIVGKRSLPPDAKKFPVGFSHKQGLQLITKTDDLKHMGGKKT